MYVTYVTPQYRKKDDQSPSMAPTYPSTPQYSISGRIVDRESNTPFRKLVVCCVTCVGIGVEEVGFTHWHTHLRKPDTARVTTQRTFLKPIKRTLR